MNKARSVEGRAVAVRADFNVPLDDGRIADATRIERTLPTLTQLVDAGARVVVLSHLGRPGGQPRAELSLAPVARRLDAMLDAPVGFCPEASGSVVRRAVAEVEPGAVLLLENTRFLPGETANEAALAEDWASWADDYVLDAFGTAHRAHASTDGLPRAVRAKGGSAVAGLLVARELEVMRGALDEPRRPFVAVLGGAKISGKIDVIESLLPRVDRLLVGGAMANTFLLAMGLETGRSLVEPDRVATAMELMEAAGPKMVLPVDCLAADGAIRAGAVTRVVERSGVAAGEAIGDIGPATVRLFGEFLLAASTVVWNGPVGVFETDGFSGGTHGVAEAIAEAADGGATAIVGGGDSAAAAQALGLAARMTHVSTGGGASLELLAGRELPGIAALAGG